MGITGASLKEMGISLARALPLVKRVNEWLMEFPPDMPEGKVN